MLASFGVALVVAGGLGEVDVIGAERSDDASLAYRGERLEATWLRTARSACTGGRKVAAELYLRLACASSRSVL